MGKSLFSQAMESVPRKTLGRIVERYRAAAGTRTLDCAELFRVMAFAQLICHALAQRQAAYIVGLAGSRSAKNYPEHLRRVRFTDPDSGKALVFLTNNTSLPALSIAGLSKSRWRVELSFKWIKQHLRIKRLLGTSENAAKTQMWCAVATCVLIAIVKKERHLNASLYKCLQSRPCKFDLQRPAINRGGLCGAGEREILCPVTVSMVFQCRHTGNLLIRCVSHNPKRT